MDQAFDPARSALLVVDVQNDYCAPGGVFERAGADIGPAQAMLPNLAALLRDARQAGVRVVFVQFTIDREGRVLNLVERRRRERNVGTIFYVVEGTWGHQVVDALPRDAGDLVIRKTRPSAFFATPLDQVLRSEGITNVVVTGVVTWGCVLATAQSAAALGYLPVVVSDCVAGANAAKHEAALDIMRGSFGDDLVVSRRELVDRWRAARHADDSPAAATSVSDEALRGAAGAKAVLTSGRGLLHGA